MEEPIRDPRMVAIMDVLNAEYSGVSITYADTNQTETRFEGDTPMTLMWSTGTGLGFRLQDGPRISVGRVKVAEVSTLSVNPPIWGLRFSGGKGLTIRGVGKLSDADTSKDT